VNTASLHNYELIAAALPSNLRTSSFNIGNETTLRNSSALQIRTAKQKLMPDAANQLNPLEVPSSSSNTMVVSPPEPAAEHEYTAPTDKIKKSRKGKAKQTSQVMSVEQLSRFFTSAY
jgi:hypothetical protein